MAEGSKQYPQAEGTRPTHRRSYHRLYYRTKMSSFPPKASDPNNFACSCLRTRHVRMPCPSVFSARGAFRHPSCTSTGAEKSDACDIDWRTEFCHVRFHTSHPRGGHTDGRHTPCNPKALHHAALAPQGPVVLPPWPTRSRATGVACVSASPGRVLDRCHSPYPLGVLPGWCDSRGVTRARGLRRPSSTLCGRCVRTYLFLLLKEFGRTFASVAIYLLLI
jgi:hypothetical protein